jgi:hypothetical protein
MSSSESDIDSDKEVDMDVQSKEDELMLMVGYFIMSHDEKYLNKKPRKDHYAPVNNGSLKISVILEIVTPCLECVLIVFMHYIPHWLTNMVWSHLGKYVLWRLLVCSCGWLEALNL